MSASNISVSARNSGAEQDGAAHRRQRVLRLDQDGGRRVQAHALQRAQHLGEHAAPGAKRTPDAVLLVFQCFEPAGDVVYVLA
jgi:hypothetical protein